MDFGLKRDDYLWRKDCGEWTVIKPIPYEVPNSGLGVVPAGFKTDICTAVGDGDWWLACVIHDWLYVRAEQATVGFLSKAAMRRAADLDLAWLIQRVSKRPFHDLVAAVYLLGVRTLGWMIFWRHAK